MKMANNVVEIIDGVVGQLKEIARTESIVGEPITVGNKTLVPIVRISVGFGAGGGEGSDDKDRSGFGGGGAGGARVEPAAFIVIDETGISLLPAKPGTIDTLIDAIPTAIGKLGKLAKKFSSDDKDSEKTSSPDSDSSASEAPDNESEDV
jgi:uncharacterized spore protein YtfJ